MMMALFSQERIDRFKHDEAVAQGIEIGEAKGSFNTLSSLVRNNLLAKDVAASQLGITEEEFDKRYKALGVTDC